MWKKIYDENESVWMITRIKKVINDLFSKYRTEAHKNDNVTK